MSFTSVLLRKQSNPYSLIKAFSSSDHFSLPAFIVTDNEETAEVEGAFVLLLTVVLLLSLLLLLSLSLILALQVLLFALLLSLVLLSLFVITYLYIFTSKYIYIDRQI